MSVATVKPSFGRAVGEVKPATAWHRYACFTEMSDFVRAFHSFSQKHFASQKRFACFTLLRLRFARNLSHAMREPPLRLFWSATKRRLAKFNGVKANFELHLKECEFRWRKDENLMYNILLKLLKKKGLLG